MATKPRYSKEKMKEIVAFSIEHGEQKTLEAFGITSGTLNRTKAQFNKSGENLSGNLQKIKEMYTDKELQAIASGGRIIPGQDKIPIIDFSGKKFRFAYFTDTHMASKYFLEEMFFKMLDKCKKEKVDAYLCGGDVTEGMSNRPGHIYELTHLGADCQEEYAVSVLKNIKKPLYLIDGNHDRWWIQSAGVHIVKNIAEKIKNATFLGHDTGIINIKKCNIQVWHGLDGNSYATSYRIQKVIESMTGGTKPNVLLLGHTHKMAYIFERNIHAISGGCIQTQSDWMRGKRIAAHTGFWIIDLTINKKGNVSSCTPTWYPFYQ